MRRVSTVLLVTSICLCDLAVTTLLFSHIDDIGEQFKLGVYSFQFDQSIFDLWVLGAVRTCCILGVILAMLVHFPDTLQRVRYLRTVIICASSLMTMYTTVRLLVITENEERLHDHWCWSMFVWSAVSCWIFCIEWVLLGRASNRTLTLTGGSINSDEASSETEKLLSNKANTTTRVSEGGSQKPSRATVLRLVSYSKPDIHLLLIAFFFLTASAAGEIFIPYYTGRVVDGIVIDKSQNGFTSAIISMALISLGSAFAAGLRGGFFSIAIQRLNIRIRTLLFSTILKQEIGFFDQVKTGEITSRMTSDVTTMSDTVGLNINIFLRSLIKAIGVVFFMFKLSWRLTMVTLIGIPFVLFVSKLYGKYYKELSEKVQDSLAVANTISEEVCSSMRTVRSFANEDGELERFKKSLSETYRLYKKEAVMYSGYMWSTRTFELGLTVAVLYYGGHLVITGRLTGGILVSFILYQIQLGDCFDGMGQVYTALMQAVGASQKVFEYIDRQPDIENTGQHKPENIQGRVEFRNVNFSYPSRPHTQVLKNVSFQVRPGEVVALVGPSGGGKSTCICLLQHFYQPQSGEVLLDAVPIQQYDHKYLHRKVALVGQEPVLYGRSVEENISYGLYETQWNRLMVEEAAKMANAHQFISEMKDGYRTQAGEKGTQMSGGQKQRVAIARALLRKPCVLILDEATSALDSESEHAVQQALYKNLSGKTVIIIAHRLSTVERADRIIVIDKGEVVEQGTHQQLLKQKGLYTSLVRRQLRDPELDKAARESRQSSGETSQICTCRRRRISSGGNVRRHFSGSSQLSSDSGESPNVTFIIGSA